MTAKMGMWREKLTGTATTTTHTLTSEAVPVGERRFLVSGACKTDTTSNADVTIFLVSHGTKYLLCGLVNMTTALAKRQRHMLWLSEGEYLSFEFSGIVATEVCEVGIIGHVRYPDVA